MARHDGPTIKVPGAIDGKVIHVDDGDTLTVLDGEHYKRVIRLSDIDAPEKSHGGRPGQPFASKATEHLKSLALGQVANATCFDIDARPRQDGTVRERYICRVLVGGTDVGMALVDAGWAMAYRQNPRYIRDASTLQHEEAAHKARRGLWAQAQPIPPWEWRRTCWERRQCESAGN